MDRTRALIALLLGLGLAFWVASIVTPDPTGVTTLLFSVAGTILLAPLLYVVVPRVNAVYDRYDPGDRPYRRK